MTSTWCLTRGLILSAALGAALVPLHGAAQQPAVPASGTPATLSPAAAAVVDIAGASGFIDVVGVKLGARLVDAITALRTYSPKMTFHAFAYQRYEALPKIDFGHTVMGRVRSPQYRQGYDDMEAVVMRVTLPPSPLLVWEVFRHVEWKHGTGPTSENVIAGLREKYGHETGTYLMDGPGPQLWWVYDRQGHHVATERIAQAWDPPPRRLRRDRAARLPSAWLRSLIGQGSLVKTPSHGTTPAWT